jgi:hypothetical protein
LTALGGIRPIAEVPEHDLPIAKPTIVNGAADPWPILVAPRLAFRHSSQMPDVLPFPPVQVRVFNSLAEFEAAFKKRCGEARTRFALQDKELHARLDMELTSKIDRLYIDVLGPWEPADAEWWHNMDFYGDGVRALQFVLHRFPPDSLVTVRGYLSGAHDGFSMLIWFWQNKIEDKVGPFGGLWMTARETLLTRSLIGPLQLDT